MIYDCIVVGAGQAGLASGYYLKKFGVNFLILDKVAEVGTSWKDRYDSLVLFTPNKYCQLPGADLPGDRYKNPTKDEIASYLKKYAAEQKLPVIVNQEVAEITFKNGLYTVVSSTGSFSQKYETKTVILATGPFHTPYIPEVHKQAGKTFQIHSFKYKNPSQIKGKKVLVVGGGNSGAQIAEELANVRENKVSFSVKGHLSFIPAKIFGKNVFWWLEKLKLLYAPKNSLRSRFLMGAAEPIIGTKIKGLIKEGKVELVPEIINLKEGEFDTIIWATGFRQNYPFLKIPNVLNEKGELVQEKGVIKNQFGLYCVGQIWQRTRSSALVGGVGRDAEKIVAEITKTLKK